MGLMGPMALMRPISLLWPQQITGDPTFLAFIIFTPVPAVNLADRFEPIAAFHGEDCGVESFQCGVSSLAEWLKDVLGNISIVAIAIRGPDPAGPNAVGGTDADFITGLETNRVAVFFFVIGVGSESGHGGNKESGPDWDGECFDRLCSQEKCSFTGRLE
jgi:hypothetical protein